MYLAGRVSEKSRPLVYHALKNGPFKSEVTGGQVNRYLPEKDDLNTVIHDQIETTVEARMPLGYAIPSAWTGVVDLLRLHGVEMERIPRALDGEFETYRFSNIRFAQASVEGHVAVNFDTRTVKEHIVLPAGSWWVSLKQRRARLVMAMLEPEAPDSLARWGLMNPVFETGFGGRVGRLSLGADRAPHDGGQPGTAPTVRGQVGSGSEICSRPARAAGVVVSAVEVRAGRHRPLSDREDLAEDLVTRDGRRRNRTLLYNFRGLSQPYAASHMWERHGFPPSTVVSLQQFVSSGGFVGVRIFARNRLTYEQQVGPR